MYLLVRNFQRVAANAGSAVALLFDITLS